MLKIGEETFKTRRVSITWQLMTFQRAQRLAASDDPDKREEGGAAVLGAMYALVKRVIAKDEWSRFEAYMDDADIEPGALEEAIGEAIASLGAEETSHPKEPSGDSSQPPKHTEVMSRHVSFS